MACVTLQKAVEESAYLQYIPVHAGLVHIQLLTVNKTLAFLFKCYYKCHAFFPCDC